MHQGRNYEKGRCAEWQPESNGEITEKGGDIREESSEIQG